MLYKKNIMGSATVFLITCEHGGNRVPARYRDMFRNHAAMLQTHRGYDPGALAVARELSAALSATLFFSTTSRLIIDLNRSVGHPHLYSEATREAPDPVKAEILKRYYLPYRTQAEAFIDQAVGRGHRVVHVSCHSFTPQLNGEVRNADIGLLYDPSRPGEVELCRHWLISFQSLVPGMKVRRNYPYTGKSDGFTAYLRRNFPADAYIGVELEVNQKHVLKGRAWRLLRSSLIDSLRAALTGGLPFDFI